MHRTILISILYSWLVLIIYGTQVSATPSPSERNADSVLATSVDSQLKCKAHDLEPKFSKKLNTRRVKVSYPVVSVPPMTVDNGMAMFNDLNTYLPCHDCLILSMEADVEYKDGTQATPASSFWLHHAVFVNKGKLDHFCGPKSWGQRFFAVGNERTVVKMSSSDKHAEGYHIEKSDEVAVSIDLMNMSLEEKEVIFTVTYEFIEDIPRKFVSVEPVWLDIGGCQTSSAPAQPDAVFDFTSPSWSSTLSGKIVLIAAHLHDGGTHLEVRKDDKVVCNALPEYKSYSMHKRHSEEHIETISTCSDAERMSLNDQWKVKAFYNTSQHQPMVNMDGSLEPVMGISLVYVAIDQEKGHSWCGWLAHRNFILPVLCMSFGTLLAAVWWRQRRDRSRQQFSQERSEWWRLVGQDLKMPLLSSDSD